MYLKNKILLYVFFINNVFGILHSGYVSNMNSLYYIEKKILLESVQRIGVFQCKRQSFDKNVIEQRTDFEIKLSNLIFNMNNNINFFSEMEDDFEPERVKQIIKKHIYSCNRYIQNNQDLTNLFKKLTYVLCKQFCMCLKKFNMDHIEEDFSVKMDEAEQDTTVIDSFFINNLDRVQIFLESVIKSYEKLKKNLSIKRTLVPIVVFQDIKIFHCYSIDIFCSGLLNTCYALKLPESFEKICKDFTYAFEQGFRDLPYDARHYIVAKIEEFLDDPEIELGINSLRMLVQQRRNILDNSNIDALDLEMYAKSLEVCAIKIKKVMMGKKQDQNVSSKKLKSDPNLIPGIVALERLIFKK